MDMMVIEAVYEVAEAAQQIEALKGQFREVLVEPPIEQYAASMVRATQPENSPILGGNHGPVHVEAANRYVSFGSSPRGAQALILGAKVRALLDGRANISYDDIDQIAPAALQHPIILNYPPHSHTYAAT